MKTLLLDYDGVVLRNKTCTQYQLRRSARFVQSKTNFSMEQSELINKTHYIKYGHTVNMLNIMFNSRTTLEEYNEFVFDTNKIKKLNRFIDKETHTHGMKFNNVITKCENENINWYIYTNAHINWVKHFSNLMSLPINENKIIWPENLDLLKPHLKSYDRIDSMFPDHKFMMVDDSIGNLFIPEKKSWDTMLFGPAHDADHIVRALSAI